MTPSTDYVLIKKIFTDKRIFDLLTDDFTPDKWEIPESLTYLVSDDEDGVVMVVPRSNIEAEVHIAILPEAKNKSVYYGRKALKWMFDEDYLKVTAMVPFFNEQTFKYCMKLGFKQEGINRMSFMKNGKLQDQWFLGLTKENWTCHQ